MNFKLFFFSLALFFLGFSNANASSSSFFEIWTGAGYNYLKYTQKSSTIGSDIKYDSFKGPSAYSMLKLNPNGAFVLIFSKENSPGESHASDTIDVLQGQYNWVIYTAEAVLQPDSWKFKFLGFDNRWGLRFGGQYHLVPFIVRDSVNGSVSTVDIQTNDLTIGTCGFNDTLKLSDRWNFEIFMLYQQPTKVGDKFTLKPITMFNGSVGLYRKFGNHLDLGLFWYGQSHSYKYTAHDKILDADIEGEQTQFFSNAELRLGLEF